VVLNKIIKTGIQKLIQHGLVKKVHSQMTVEGQWQWAASVAEGGLQDITGADKVATSKEAVKASSRRALGGKSLWVLNHKHQVK
jgi:hypothetical protein